MPRCRDPADADGDKILFEPSTGENDNTKTPLTEHTIRETGFKTPKASGGKTPSEEKAPVGDGTRLEGPTGKPVFSYDVRMERRREKAVYVTPDGARVGFGPIMRYGP